MNHVDLRSFNILSLCTGAGGLELGLRLAYPTARTVCCVEHEAYACEVLATRMEGKALDDAPVWTNLRTFDGRPWSGKVHCIAGGYPCQPFSVAGQRKGADDPRHLWPDVARIVREVEPEWCFFENVANHLNLGFPEVAGELQSMGYRLAAGLFTAAEVGASHKRERLFILAHSYDARSGNTQPVGFGWSTTEFSGQRTQMANSQREGSQRVSRGGLSGSGRASVQSTRKCGPVAHSNEPRLEGRSLRERGRVEQWTTGTSSRKMANPNQQHGDHRRPGTGEVRGEWRQPTRVCRGELPLFPPGPADQPAWQSVSKIAPTLEPGICGVADGVARRVERLRLCGNGVVPLVAAYAFRVLTTDLESS
jgi:DNA (cytosine-5)-methyltransferase 1